MTQTLYKSKRHKVGQNTSIKTQQQFSPLWQKRIRFVFCFSKTFVVLAKLYICYPGLIIPRFILSGNMEVIATKNQINNHNKITCILVKINS